MSPFDSPKSHEEIAALKEETQKDGFWNDVAAAQKVSRQLKHLQDGLNEYKKLVESVNSAEEILDLAQGDEALLSEAVEEINSLETKVNELHLSTLLKGKYDGCDATLTLHAGAGGTEAMDWTAMLYRMYARYCERVGYKVTEEDRLDGDEAGLKSVTFRVSGDYAYGYLKAEKGVHRLVRISPFDANARRHTSFASLEVMPEIENDTSIEIRPEDIRVDTYRSGGAGGQHINKTDSAVRITHLKTGIVVQCQNERSQIQNRETAMKMLVSKLVELRERENLEKANSIKGEIKKIEWGSQIRSYVFQPYTLVKDHRTGFENSDISAVMDGDIEPFINDYLRKS